jgi:hypothetical protein
MFIIGTTCFDFSTLRVCMIVYAAAKLGVAQRGKAGLMAVISIYKLHTSLRQ